MDRRAHRLRQFVQQHEGRLGLISCRDSFAAPRVPLTPLQNSAINGEVSRIASFRAMKNRCDVTENRFGRRRIGQRTTGVSAST